MKAKMAISLLINLVACADPARDAAVDALGPEAPGVAAGPLHRAGQRCLACHDGKSEARAMTVAGTVFRGEGDTAPVADVEVILTDSAHRTFVTRTNCAGNFYAYSDDLELRFPVWASVQRGDRRIDMESPMNKDGDCGHCHVGEKSPSSAGLVYVESNPAYAATIPAGCGP